MNEEIILEKEMFHITYFDEKELSFREHYEIYKNIKNDILHVLNKYNIKFVLAETEIIKDLQQENVELKENYKAILKQRDDTNKSAVETIEKYQQENARLKEFKKEHEIMKKILIEKGLWETLLNDDRFLEYLREEN